MGLSSDKEKRERQLANLKPNKKGQKPSAKSGRPRSMFNIAISEIENKIGERPSREDIVKALFYCISVDENTLGQLVRDTSKPMLIRVCAKEVLGGKGFEAVNRILDRIVGHAVDITSQGEKIKTEPTVIEVVGNGDFIKKLED